MKRRGTNSKACEYRVPLAGPVLPRTTKAHSFENRPFSLRQGTPKFPGFENRASR